MNKRTNKRMKERRNEKNTGRNCTSEPQDWRRVKKKINSCTNFSDLFTIFLRNLKLTRYLLSDEIIYESIYAFMLQRGKRNYIEAIG